MAFAKDTIKLGAARLIFTGADIQEVTIGGQVAGYKASIDGVTHENVGLTALCKTLWESQRGNQSDPRELKVRVYSYSDGRSQPYIAYALNGKTSYDWKTGNTEIEALTRLRASYISWQNLPFSVTRIEK